MNGEKQPKKVRMIKNMTEQEYNTEYMYKYKQVKRATTDKLLQNKKAYLKKIKFIDEELEFRKMNEEEIKKKEQEDNKNKAVAHDLEKMKLMYEKLKSVFEE